VAKPKPKPKRVARAPAPATLAPTEEQPIPPVEGVHDAPAEGNATGGG
jgi:hypothetical protein